MPNDRIDDVLTILDKEFGKGSVVRLGGQAVVDIPVVSTGALTLDIALGVGGFPRGRIIEIYGPESTGKTLLSLHAITEVQKAGGIAAFIDVEHALDPQYAKTIGVDLDNLLLSQPDSGEEALNITETIVRSNKVDIVVVDSVAALVPKAEIEGDMGDAHVGLQARLMSQALRKLTAAISKSKTIVIFINQLRSKVGVIYGSPEITSGGNALKFYATIRLDVRKTEQIKVGNDVVGIKTKVKVVKNKVAPPFKVAEYDMIFGKGISQNGIVFDLAIEKGLITKAGTWYTYGDTRLGQGRDAMVRMLDDKTQLAAELESAVRARAFAQPPKKNKETTAVA
jgi:recombination protein RecA